MTALILALLLSQNTPRHPSPATLNTIPVGDGTNWASSPIPTCTAGNVLTWGPGFSCVPAGGGGSFVLKAGDTMTGTLIVDLTPDSILPNNYGGVPLLPDAGVDFFIASRVVGGPTFDVGFYQAPTSTGSIGLLGRDPLQFANLFLPSGGVRTELGFGTINGIDVGTFVQNLVFALAITPGDPCFSGAGGVMFFDTTNRYFYCDDSTVWRRAAPYTVAASGYVPFFDNTVTPTPHDIFHTGVVPLMDTDIVTVTCGFPLGAVVPGAEFVVKVDNGTDTLLLTYTCDCTGPFFEFPFTTTVVAPITVSIVDGAAPCTTISAVNVSFYGRSF